MFKYNYKQTTYETCLAVNLMLIAALKPNRSKELKIWQAGWDFNFLTGQANYVAKNFDKKFQIYIENSFYFSTLFNKVYTDIKLECLKIEEKLINELIKSQPLILYIDNYIIQQIVHAPHFIILIKMEGNKVFEIFDPWDGEIKLISKEVILKAIRSLRTHLRYSPVLIHTL